MWLEEIYVDCVSRAGHEYSSDIYIYTKIYWLFLHIYTELNGICVYLVIRSYIVTTKILKYMIQQYIPFEQNRIITYVRTHSHIPIYAILLPHRRDTQG